MQLQLSNSEPVEKQSVGLSLTRRHTHTHTHTDTIHSAQCCWTPRLLCWRIRQTHNTVQTQWLATDQECMSSNQCPYTVMKSATMRRDAVIKFCGWFPKVVMCSPNLIAVIIYLSGIKNKCYSIQAVEGYKQYIHTHDSEQNRTLSHEKKHCRNMSLTSNTSSWTATHLSPAQRERLELNVEW